MTSFETPEALVSALAAELPDRGVRAASIAVRRALPVWEAMHEGDRRPRRALDSVDAWLDGAAPLDEVAAAAQALVAAPASTWFKPALAVGEAARLVAEAASTPTAALLERAVERATWALARDWRWGHAAFEQLQASLLRSMTEQPPPTRDGPRWRVARHESTGGDLYEIEYRTTFWVIDDWTGEALIQLKGETSGRLVSGSWGDFGSGGVEAVRIEGDEAVVCSVGGREERLALTPHSH